MNKRFASLAVSALLLVSLLSVPALAEGTEAAADAAGDDHVIVTLNPEAALQPETPAEAAASATETAQADPVPSADDAEEAATAAEAEVKADGTKDEQLTYVALGDSIVSGVGLADVQYSARSTASIWLPTSMATLPTAMSARWLQLSASTVTTPSTSACRP